MAGVSVQALFVYPVKSCRGVGLQRAVLMPQGLGLSLGPGGVPTALDRQWCVCDSDGLVQDIRCQPTMATIDVAIEGSEAPETATLVLRSSLDAGFPSLRVPVAEGAYAGNAEVRVRDRHRDLWFGRPLPGRCAGLQASEWVTRLLRKHNPAEADETFRLVRFEASRDERRVAESFRGKSPVAKVALPGDAAAFADCAGYHLLSEESLQDLTGRVPPGSGLERPVSYRRFRPNILVRGGAAYAEDAFLALRLGAARLRQLGPTARCVIPTTDVLSGVRDAHEEPRASLMKYRPLPFGDGVHGGPTLGVWLALDAGDAGTEIQVGELLQVETWKPPSEQVSKL